MFPCACSFSQQMFVEDLLCVTYTMIGTGTVKKKRQIPPSHATYMLGQDNTITALESSRREASRKMCYMER